ncbi:hypothetical protein M405DRAFT_862302 [Rhizopogon salebrosus TDB-379]|nr:hypothetical protein M405DRAFT_862302 [Rhizopogon salebrosus TDB-379]
MSSRSLVGLGGEAEETLRPRLGKCDGNRRESEVVVEPGKRIAPRGNKFQHIEDSACLCKTTLLQKVYNATGKSEIFDGKGNKINADVVKPSVDRGYHDIKNELVFRSNPGFVFHDSCRFEVGGEEEFKKMKQFVSECASARELNECIHAIWQAIVSMRMYLLVRTQNLLSILRCTPRSLGATSDPSQSRRRGPHLAEHENIEAEVIPPASALPPRMHSTTGA